MDEIDHRIQLGKRVFLGSLEGKALSWIVLFKSKGELLLLCEQAVGESSYEEIASSVTDYLESFYMECFTEEEKCKIGYFKRNAYSEACDRITLLNAMEASFFLEGEEGAENGLNLGNRLLSPHAALGKGWWLCDVFKDQAAYVDCEGVINLEKKTERLLVRPMLIYSLMQKSTKDMEIDK